MLEINLTSVFPLCQLAADIMFPKGYGKIINMASMLTFFGSTLVSAYAASKGGIGQITKTLANEWASHGISVNAIAPGYMDTEMTTPLKSTPVRKEQVLAAHTGGALGSPGGRKGRSGFLGFACLGLGDWRHHSS